MGQMDEGVNIGTDVGTDIGMDRRKFSPVFYRTSSPSGPLPKKGKVEADRNINNISNKSIITTTRDVDISWR